RERVARALENGSTDLADACHSLRIGRRPYAHRLAVVAGDAAGAAAALRDAGGGRASVAGGREPHVVFLLPGQGVQRPGMVSDLYEAEVGFRECVDDCAERLRPWLGADIRRLLVDRRPSADLDDTSATQPALFVAELALATLWRSLGVEPRALI